MDVTFLDNIDIPQLNDLMSKTEENVKYFNDTCQNIVKTYCADLDDLMMALSEECIAPGMNDSTFEAPLNRLQAYYLELSSRVYFSISRLESLGVYADMSDSAYKEIYSKEYISLSGDKDDKGKAKKTVEELKSQSNMKAQYNSVVASIYDRAYKIVKSKVSSAQDMMDTLRRLISTRTTEMQLYNQNIGE